MLSIAAICRNEIGNIRAFVNSWRVIADEIVILDTGSTDGTLEALDRLQDEYDDLRVHQFKWNDDFSAARNTVASYCSGNWILWADLDDRLDTVSISDILTLVAQPKQQFAYRFQVASKMENNVYQRFMQTRLYPNLPSYRWRGTIHESVDHDLIIGGCVISEKPEIIVAHLGYENIELRRAKASRNLSMLLQLPDTAANSIQKGDAWYILSQFSTGLQCYQTAIRLAPYPIEAEKLLAEKVIIGAIACKMFDMVEVYINKLEQHSVESNFWQAELETARGNWILARIYYARSQNIEFNPSCISANADVIRANSAKRLAEIDRMLACV